MPAHCPPWPRPHVERPHHAGASLALATLLVGCAAPKPLYSWNGYQNQVYQYLKSDGPATEEQILALEKGVQVSASQGAQLPPGYQAHLGLAVPEHRPHQPGAGRLGAGEKAVPRIGPVHRLPGRQPEEEWHLTCAFP